MTCPSGEHTIQGVTTVSDYAFYGCSTLTKVVIPDIITTIGSYAFYNNVLGSCDFGEDSQVETLKDYAFYNIFFENDVYIPSSVKNWGKYCFKNSDSCYLSSRPFRNLKWKYICN